ncbi:hypothetical protein [Ktedonospora formicarum]|nr:hypothetical protein [Ktedonospora formicarum]
MFVALIIIIAGFIGGMRARASANPYNNYYRGTPDMPLDGYSGPPR